VRSGLSSSAQAAAGANYLGAQVAVAVNGAPAQPVSVRLHGPGQVTGIDPRAIVRTEPLANTATFESNYFPCVEFATPDFPWSFTPAAPAGPVLRPWLCLVVVREQAGIALVPRAKALPLLQFTDPAVPVDELPNLDQIVSWAHAQVVVAPASSADAVKAALTGPPASRLSRIICPRRLEPSTGYLVCLVPTFHAGLQAGLTPDLPVDDADVAPAWDANVKAPFSLPVYASWRFSTGVDGDFASLARRMRPPKAPLGLGIRDMDISVPGFGLPAFPGLVLGLEGALRSPESTPKGWPDGNTQSQFEQAVRPLLEPAAASVPVVAPPVYAQVPSGPLSPPTGSPPVWLGELNLDPRWRAAAGMGVAIVRADQESLMASAWDQWEALRKANQLLRQMQLARVVATATHTRQFGAVDGAGTLLQLTRPLHARVRLNAATPLTLDAQLVSSSIAIGAVSAAFRRLSRRGGPIGRRLYLAGTSSRIVERLNVAAGAVGAVAVMTPRVPPQGVVLLQAVSPQTSAAELSPTVIARAGGWAVSNAATTTTITTVSVSATTQPTTTTTTSIAAHLVVAAAPVRTPGGGLVAAPPVSAGAITQLPTGTLPGVALPRSPTVPPDIVATKEMILRFRNAATAVANFVTTRTARILDDPARPPLAATLPVVQSLTLQAVDPSVTLVARARARLPLPATGDPLRPLLGSPTFGQAMSRELEPRQLLPGVETVPPETAAMLVTNPAFVEAFMVGLNDEMRREFAWRQYPTDQRGTFFTHFWSTGAGAAAVDDIAPIASWDRSKHLGDNATVQGEQVVLLLRGELLRRYPNTIISVVQAGPGPNNQRTLTTTELFPVFKGSLDPDLVFFGFNLSQSDATAGDGWYFVLAEHPTEPRFGFERAAGPAVLGTWNDLGWPQVTVTHNHLDLSGTPPSGALEGATWNADSAQQASITFRRPVRLALHATALLG
jgi:hypothetical protein